jgi:SAM-dependent methyltransferase
LTIVRADEGGSGQALRSGDRHYRAYVGPPGDYDLIGGLQFTLLFQAGLRETHRLLDLGCGSLRGGRLFIPYLRPGHYYGVEPNEWLVQEGIANELGGEVLSVKRPTFSAIDDFSMGSLGVQFDFVMAHSILTHTFPDLAVTAFSGIRDSLNDAGLLIATFRERGDPQPGSGWSYPKPVPYAWPDFRALAEGAGLQIRRLSWPHPRAVWFVGALEQGRVEEAVDRIDAAEKPLL